jgi:hypothetical protein
VRRLNSVRGWLDAFVAEIDFGLAAMMGYVNEHGQEDFASGETAIGRVVRFAELLFGEIGIMAEQYSKELLRNLTTASLSLSVGEGSLGALVSCSPAQKR